MGVLIQKLAFVLLALIAVSGARAQTVPDIDIKGAVGSEGDTALVLTLDLQSRIEQPLVITVASEDDSAKTNQDYYGFFQTLEFSPTQTTQTISVPLIDDAREEGTEAFFLIIGTTQSDAVSRHRIEIRDNDGNRPGLSVGDVVVSESATRVAVRVELSSPVSETVSVLVRSDSDSAVSGQDFLDVWQVISFSPGETEQEVAIAIINDALIEPDETFKVLLMNATGASIERAVGRVVIADDGDGMKPALKILSTRVMESANEAVVTVSLHPAAAAVVSMTIRTVADSATGSNDYRDVYQVLNFDPGEIVRHIKIPLVDDTVKESEETFFVGVEDVTGADVTDIRARITIVDDDSDFTQREAILSVEAQSINESQGMLPVTVRRNGEFSGRTSVRLSVLEDTAQSGVDFVALSEVVVFKEDESHQVINVELLDDSEDEQPEALTLVLSDADGATVGVSPLSVPLFDDDVGEKLTLSVDDITVVENDIFAELIVRLSASTDTTVTVNVETRGETALVPTDYYDLVTTVTFAPGEVDKSVKFYLVDDYQVEESEDVLVVLSDAQGATIGKGEARVTIEDNDSW